MTQESATATAAVVAVAAVVGPIMERLVRVETLVTQHGLHSDLQRAELVKQVERIEEKLDGLLQGNHKNHLASGGGWAAGGAGVTAAVVAVLKAAGVL